MALFFRLLKSEKIWASAFAASKKWKASNECYILYWPPTLSCLFCFQSWFTSEYCVTVTHKCPWLSCRADPLRVIDQSDQFTLCNNKLSLWKYAFIFILSYVVQSAVGRENLLRWTMEVIKQAACFYSYGCIFVLRVRRVTGSTPPFYFYDLKRSMWFAINPSL